MRSLALVALLFAATPVSASTMPNVKLSWDDCSVITRDKSWSGPGSYALVISATNMSGKYRLFTATLGFYPRRVVPAWDFSTYDLWGGTPCQGPGRLSVSSLGGSCPAFPAASTTATMWEGSLTNPGVTFLDVREGFDFTFESDPALRYTLLRIAFDHSQSVAGPSTAGTCGQAEEPMCANLLGLEFRDGFNQMVFASVEQGYATWQDPQNTTNCPGATPVVGKTWGAIKATYR